MRSRKSISQKKRHLNERRQSLRALASLIGVTCVFLIGLVSAASSFEEPLWQQFRPLAPADTDSTLIDLAGVNTLTPSDTDSVLLNLAGIDSLLSDTTDTLVVNDTSFIYRYIPLFRQDDARASLFPRQDRPLSTRLGNYWRHEVTLDSTSMTYVTTESVGDFEVRYPVQLDYETYRARRLEMGVRREFERLADQASDRRRRQQSRGGLGFNIVVPGGRESAFSTIFGTTDIDLRVNGQANINAGFNIRKSDQQTSITGRETQVDPEFRQDLRLGIVGSIGDKMKIDVNWDTERDFDYQNQLKLHYEGYDDDIIKSIEAGNVFLQTPSSLIRGGQSLFGIKSEFQVGGIQFQTVISQQEGESNNLSIDGGSETVPFDLRPTDYDEKTHFFLSYYFRNRWEDALDDPPLLTVADNFERITRIEVWKLQRTSPENLDLRKVIAVVDLGEEIAVREEANNYLDTVLPNTAIDDWDEATLTKELIDSKGLDASDFQTGDFFKKLEEGRDYEVDDVLGYLSLNQRVQDFEAIAVAYEYVAGGRNFKVGEFAADKPDNDTRLVLKLIRPQDLQQPNLAGGFNPAAWYLELRNIYPLKGRGINANEFELQVNYQAPGQPSSKTLPGVGQGRTLLQILGLDRLNVDEAARPDDRFDYLVNYTIDPGRGLLIFPYLEPFGQRISDEIDETVTDPAANTEAKEKFVFDRLYLEKKENARRDTQLDVYQINGSYKGSVQSFYNLNAFAGVVEGSVRVTAGGTPLQEGADYTVDYQGGTVSITNPAFLTAGRKIEIDYESNSLFNIQKKTLMGARAFYEFEDKLNVGTTVMRLSQKSPVDKFRVGEEPIANVIWGLDGNLKLEPRWLTRAVDALPLIQTRAPSTMTFTGEFAQLRPGHTETTAFRRTQRDLRSRGLDFNDDELKGISYVDDFEGFETTFSLKQAGAWQLAAPPDSIRMDVEPDPALPRAERDSLRTNWRSTFAWYQLNVNTLRQLDGKTRFNEAVSIVEINDVFPEQNTQGEVDRTLTTLDLYFDPTERGPYNYTRALDQFLQQPQNAWGGMTQRLPEGFNDFNLKNIEFVEFVMRPYPGGQSSGDAGPDAKLYVNLGTISEDVIPNGELNTEDGLSISSVGTPPDQWSRLPSVVPDNVINVQGDRTEDLGLDGLVSYDPASYEPQISEQQVFADFLATIDNGNPDPRYQTELAKIRIDPSGDDYHNFDNDQYFLNSNLYAETPTLQQRFSRYFPSSELNAFESQNKLATNTSVKRGNSQIPDTEDLNLNSTVNTANNYFEYEVPLSKAELDRLGQPDELDDFVIGEVTNQEGGRTGWYLIRIPVQTPTRVVGNIQDFSKIQSLRLWTTGHQIPITMRFATFDLVGSQWRKSEFIDEKVSENFTPIVTDTRVTISSINNEEDADIYRSPFGTVISQTRLATGGTQEAREQALLLRAENLPAGAQRAIFKTFPQPFDFLKYSNLRLFVHMHGELADGRDLATLDRNVARDKVKLFIRLGANETNDYYEYEQPLTPSEFPGSGNPDEIWQTQQQFGDEFIDLNSVNILLGALNQLKVARDDFIDGEGLPFPTDSLFWHAQNGTNLVDVERFAPPGTRIGIKGTPSLGRINTIVMGIRNPVPAEGEIGDELGDVTLWLNELRTAGYDETNGWAALANVDFKLADLGRFKANIRRQTDGFGSLESSLGERDQNDINNWSVAGDINLDKFIPEKAGWSIPVSAQIQSNTSTPRFAPSRGDVRLSEITGQIRDREDLTPEEKQLRIKEAEQAAQTHSYTRSMSFRIAKQNSRWPLFRVLVDGISFNYSYTDTDSRSPSQKLRDSWRWNGNLGYRLTVRQPKTVRPFWFLEPVPLLKLLGDLRFNYLPQSLNASATASRNFSAAQERTELDLNETIERARFPIREQHTFSHRRNVSVQYNPFQFLNLSFDTSTDQSLNQLGVQDTLINVIDIENGGVRYEGRRIEEVVADPNLGYEDADIGVRLFEERELNLRSARGTFNKFLSNDDDIRTERHDQRFNATFQPTFSRNGFLNWITIQPVTYSAQYGWQNAALGRLTGASVRSQVSVRSGVTLRPIELWRKIPFYVKMEEQQQQAEQKAQQRRRDKEVARQEKREARKQAKEERRRLRREEVERKREEEEQLRQINEEREAQGLSPFETYEEAFPPPEVPPDSVQVEPDSVQVEPGYADDEDVSSVEDPQEEVEQPAEEQPETDPNLAPPEDENLAHPEDENLEPPAEENARKKRQFPIRPKPLAFMRRIVLAVTGVRDLGVTYTASRNSSSSNVGLPLRGSNGVINDVKVNYSLYDALFKDKGPSVRYRFGLERKIPLETRIVTENLQVTDVLSDNNRIQAQTALNPSSQLTINLNWSLDWGTNENFTFRPIGLDEIERTATERGNNKASVWAFQADYLSLFTNQLDTYVQDARLAADPSQFGDENGDGRVILTNVALVKDFNDNYIFGKRKLDRLDLLPFPLPGWRVNYTGLSNWPVFSLIAQSATLRHGYSADYSTDYRSNVFTADGETTQSFGLAGKQLTYNIPEVETGAVRINERFQPLVGVDLSFKNQIQTNLAWNKSNTFSLSTTSFEVNESKTSELTFTASYQKRGMKLPFFKKKLDNRVSFSLTFSRAIINDQRLRLRRALEEAIAAIDQGQTYDVAQALQGDNISIVSASTRLTIAPQISYQFSNRVAGDFRLRIENFDSEDSRIPSTKTTSGTFNIRVSIQSN